MSGAQWFREHRTDSDPIALSVLASLFEGTKTIVQDRPFGCFIDMFSGEQGTQRYVPVVRGCEASAGAERFIQATHGQRKVAPQRHPSPDA